MVADRQTPAALALGEFNPPAVIVHDRTAVADNQARASRHLEMVQRVRIRGFFAVRHNDDEDLS